MRIATVIDEGTYRVAIERADGDWALAPEPGDLGTRLGGGSLPPEPPPEWPAVARETLAFTAPLPRPRRNIICLGLNYAEHARESQDTRGEELALPEAPVVFTKATTTAAGPRDDLELDPAVTEQLDWEVELGVVIGRGGRRIPEERALEHVLGYTVINDLSARDLQFRHKQFFLGKSLDGSCPMGPWLTTADAVPDPHRLELACHVNGVRKQHGSTADMVFGVPAIIARLSHVMSLEPGDVIATGTPDGVGFARNPPEFLQPGDQVRCEIEGLGSLDNRIVPAGR